MIIARLIYYCFFEITLQASPAKMLTETRVISDDGDKPTPGAVIKRTLSRFIPFNALSFFGHAGWHDTISYTQVVNEQRTGVSGSRYLLIFPGIFLVALGSYLIHEAYENHQSYLYRKNEHNEMVEHFRSNIANLTTSHVIKIEDVKDSYGDDIYLKIEEIDGENIVAAMIRRQHSYSKSLVEIEELYNYYKAGHSLLEIPLKRSDFEQAYTPDYDHYRANKLNTRPLLLDQREFRIVEIDRLFGPSIHDRGTGSVSSDISMALLNYGWPAEVVSLETLEGTVQWTNALPLEVPTVEGHDYPSFHIHCTNYQRGDKYKFKMVVKDSLDHTQTYIIEGHDLKKKITRLD
jgi:hypothetical protein